MSMTFAELKEQYPNPVISSAGNGKDGMYRPADSYCVGGAFCAGQGIPEAFPEADDLGEYLKIYNRKLPYDKTYEFGHIISDLNDDGDFDGAWGALEQAMNYKPEGEA